jgi:hypothetical protein
MRWVRGPDRRCRVVAVGSRLAECRGLALDRLSAPLLGCNVSHRLRELPAVTGEILERALTLANSYSIGSCTTRAPCDLARSNCASTSATRTLMT